MKLKIVSPAGAVVSLVEAKQFMHVDSNADDDVIDKIIESVEEWLGGESGWLGRALGDTTFSLTIPSFPYHPLSGIALQRPPLSAVDSVAYFDHDGDEQALGDGVYRLTTDARGIGHIILKSGESWPATDPNSEIEITYRAGYGPGRGAPRGLKQAILMTVGRLYASSQSVGLNLETDDYVRKLFAPYRVFA